MISEFLKYVVNVIFPKPAQPLEKFSHRQLGGIRLKEPDRISELSLSEPESIHNTGYTIAKPRSAMNA
jgi:hypothetical protein